MNLGVQTLGLEVHPAWEACNVAQSRPLRMLVQTGQRISHPLCGFAPGLLPYGRHDVGFQVGRGVIGIQRDVPGLGGDLRRYPSVLLLGNQRHKLALVTSSDLKILMGFHSWSRACDDSGFLFCRWRTSPEIKISTIFNFLTNILTVTFSFPF